MKTFPFGYVPSSCVATAMLAGCGGSQPPIDVPGAMAPLLRSTSRSAALKSIGNMFNFHQAPRSFTPFSSAGGGRAINAPDAVKVDGVRTTPFSMSLHALKT
jgi:hypothetical protein